MLILGGLQGDAPAVAQALYAAGPVDTSLIVLLPGNALGPSAADRYDALQALAERLRGTGARALLLPGRMEWERGRKGLEALAGYLDSLPGRPIRMPLQGGCPGPEVLELGTGTVLLLMDSEWWLQDEDRRPGVESSCDTRMPFQILDELDDALTAAAGKTVLFATAGTLHSTGIRGGYFGPRQHVFPLTDIRGLERAYLPLPVAGSLYPFTRGLLAGHHDAAGRRYRIWTGAVEPLLDEHPALVAVSGNERLLQLYKDNQRSYVTSGAAHAGGRATRTRHTPFTTVDAGFALLTVMEGGTVSALFYTRTATGFQPVHRSTLIDGAHLVVPPAEPSPAADAGRDSVMVAIHPSYDKTSRFRRWLLGTNYRQEWAAPIRLPVFRPAAEGFSFVEKGGGNTTTAIRVRDGAGTVWSLRSILKRFDKVLPPSLRATVAEDILRDAGSAAYPWAGGLSAPLADAAGLPRPRLRYVYLPPEAATDTALGGYGPAYAGTVAVLEERTYSRFGEDTKSSWTVFNRALDGKPEGLEATSLLRSRGLDLVLADIDRHYAQWKWEAHNDSAGRRRWWAIPKDRDQAFFHFDGVVARLGLAGQSTYLKGFTPRLNDAQELSFVARDIDTWGLNELAEAAWNAELTDLQASLSDRVIEGAVGALPPAFHAARGAYFDSGLRSRRADLVQAGLDYYRFLAQRVTVLGTNRRDSFDLAPDGTNVALTLWTWEKDADTPVRRYARTFRPGETRELRLFGFGDDDFFRVQPGVLHGIRLRLVGGNGQDRFSVESPVRTWIYDEAGNGNILLARRRGTTDMLSHREDVNRYTFRGNDYNTSAQPSFVAGFNAEDGLFFGLGASVQKQGFRAEPYKLRHTLSATVVPGSSAFAIRAGSTVNDLWRHYDVVAAAALVTPVLQNFFGLGNETVRDADRPLSYYRVRYTTLAAEALVRKRLLAGRLSLAAGPALFRYSANEGRADGRVLETPAAVGLDPDRIFRSLLYGGGRLRIDFNSLDQALLPVRGARWATDFTAMAGLDGVARPITRAESRLELFAPLSSNERFILSFRGGGGHIFSDSFEYFQALTLGANNGLRGYRKSRFSGASSLWGGAELRWRAARLNGRIFPTDIGLLSFAETGRVWLPGERSATWHSDWGGGIYLTPFRSILLSAVVAASPEESLFNLSAGASVGITF